MNTSEYLVELKKLLTYDIKEMTKSGANVSESYFVEKAIDYLEKMHLHSPRIGSTSIRDLLFGRTMGQSEFVPKVTIPKKAQCLPHSLMQLVSLLFI